MRIAIKAVLAVLLLAPAILAAQPGAEERAREERIRMDPAGLARYRDENAALAATPRQPRIVFMGDSITEGWMDKRPGFFTRGRVDRGIGGQTTPQMVLRMMSDVVALKPRAVHLMAGTNDIAGNTGPMTPEMTQNNFRAMSDIARRNGIRVILVSIPPAAGFPWAPTIKTRQPIAEMNAWLKSYAAQTGAAWVDYHTVLDDGTGAMKPGLAVDGVHPTEAGYDAMATVVEPVLARVLRGSHRS
jgi:lysophospholipase L1-like esterase